MSKHAGYKDACRWMGDGSYLLTEGVDVPVRIFMSRDLFAECEDEVFRQAAAATRFPGVTDVIITHMHYDHAGNHGLFPNARYHLQDREMAYCTGRCMCHAGLRAPARAVRHRVPDGLLRSGYQC